MKNPNFAKFCRDHRKATRWSQKDVANLMGWKKEQSVSNLERGVQTLKGSKLLEFCRVIEAPIDGAIEAMVRDYQEKLTKAVKGVQR